MMRSSFVALGFGALGLPLLAAAAGQTVSVLHAGSLTTVFQKQLAPEFERQTGVHAEGEGRGSVANANLIRAGLKNPDVFIASDADVTQKLLASGSGAIAWYATFATTRILIAYAPKSAHAARFADAATKHGRWYDALREEGVRIGRTDPAIDPKGYRTLIVGKLAERFYRQPRLEASLFGDDRNPAQTFTDEAILVRLEEGDLDAAFVYATESVQRQLPTIELRPEINLGSPHFASDYAVAAVTINGVEHRGAPIEYAFCIPTKAPNAAGGAAFLKFLVSQDGKHILDGAGLTTRDPRYFGDLASVPTALQAR